ncbi:MAG: protein tyrosine kinase [Acidiphilium sp. 37-64-53]|uniref:GumC family protein n=1 Tax=Acidiphilium TaxID=522 RepID=UPI000BD3EEF5|nr:MULTISPECIES: polysaccharide biosynthesis tyrosine autokinase [Acidiphilium]OYW02944.1 MAG: protein tyrosine kinase [Acidiphilium sp. 37-64-53]OZB30516.1 MAG: protein tyrosine kinase [Acidiphilium sp. 34-64-41]HQT85216.1 polysaccharide biosynthesis tyrosine autokinase [Acidiphilium rubrum]
MSEIGSLSPAASPRPILAGALTLLTAPDPLQPLRAIRRHWRLTALITIGLPALVALALTHQPPTYTASGTLLYAPLDFNPKLLRGVLETSQVTDTLMTSQIAVVRSTAVVDTMIKQLDLVHTKAFDPALAPSPRWRRWLGLPPRHAAPLSQRALVDQVRNDLVVTVPSGSQLLTVSFNSTDPKLAARAVNCAMQTYLDRQRADNLAVLDHAQAWLSRRAAATSAVLRALDIAIARARATAGTERGTGAAPLTNQEAGQLTDSLARAETDLAAASAQLQASDASAGTPAAAAAAIATNVAPMRARAAELAAQLGALASTEGPNYPEYRAVRHQLAALQGQIAAETARQVEAARATMQVDQARVATLKAALARLRHRTAAESILAAPLASLLEQRTAERSLLRDQTEQIGTLESQSVLTRPDARIISPADTPDAPSAPRTTLIIAGATVLGFSLGIIAALAADVLNGSFRSGGEIRTALDLPCIALIPEVTRRARRGLALPDYTRMHPFSPFNEQMRALRTSLWLDPTAPRSLAITAARPSEGKTTLAVSLAVSLAAGGMRVLVIDCDIRQPSFDAVFNLGGAPGLTDHLAGRVPCDAAIHRMPDLQLDVMPAGAVAADALSLFMAPSMRALMVALRERYDLVILDLPPVFALAESQVLAKAADATLLCIRWAETPRRVVAAALALLDQAGIRVAGTILTRVDGARHARAGFADSELYHPRYGGYFRP